jgi:tRNA dimethylallyltransferase
MNIAQILPQIAADRHVLLAGPTASGKSALALALAQQQGGVIVNGDALQVWSCWRVISARPSARDEAAAPHRLYGHMAPGADWSVGRWLGQVAELLAQGERFEYHWDQHGGLL